MKKNYFKLWFVAVLLVTISCSREDEMIAIPETPTAGEMLKDPLTTQQINTAIDESIRTKGYFNWGEATDHLLWSAIFRGGNSVSLGYGATANDFDKSKVAGAASLERELLKTLTSAENLAPEKILIRSDAYLTTMDVMVVQPETVRILRHTTGIRYIEPANYRYYDQQAMANKSSSSGSSGCGFESAALNAADYTTVAPNAKVPWSFYKHNIPAAWSYATGAGITIGIVDSGVSPEQNLLGSGFNTGQSSGRSIQKYGTYVDSVWPWSSTTDGPNDQCGHGTSMASVAAAPRNNSGLAVGVAYNANLVTYRAAANVVLEGYHEQNGVKDAFTALGNRSDVKIISMSMGHIFSVGKIEDGIKYAYSKGKLIFCAGGTSTSFTNFVGVIFPASMAEAVAVTGIKDSSTYQECDVCHKGAKIDFTVVMEKTATGSNTPVLGYYNNESKYVGGSSVATATTAGIAALVWSKNPSWTRAQVVTKMKQSASLYPNKNADFGYGSVNALLAVQ